MLKNLFITDKTNIRYLSGFSGTAGYLCLHGGKGFLFTDARYHIVARKTLPKNFEVIDITGDFSEVWASFLKKRHIREIGIEGNSISLSFWKRLKKASPGTKIIEIGETINERRIVKKAYEMRALKKAQNITDRVFSTLKRIIKKGMSEKDIAWKIECLARKFGADDISFPPIVAFNENSAAPHHQPSEKKLRTGDLILVDMGVISQGYCSDMTRMIFTKPPSPEERKIYELVWSAQEEAIRGLRIGITGKNADSLARNVIKKAGFEKEFGHSLGHGVGLDIHELPNLSQKYVEKIPAGTVVTVEPGVYLSGKFGVRLEDMVAVKKGCAENLTRSPKAIHACSIRLK